jgi:four helix bundle protein
MKPHLKLEVWKRSVEFVTEIYKLTQSFPEFEKFSLVAQMRKAAVSIPNNIAEGAGRGSKREFSQFLSIAQGSIAELETQLIISNNLDYITRDKMEILLSELNEISKMIIGLRRHLR